MTIIADYLVLASGTSDRHVRAIADGVLYDIKEMGALPLRREANSRGTTLISRKNSKEMVETMGFEPTTS